MEEEMRDEGKEGQEARKPDDDGKGRGEEGEKTRCVCWGRGCHCSLIAVALANQFQHVRDQSCPASI